MDISIVFVIDDDLCVSQSLMLDNRCLFYLSLEMYCFMWWIVIIEGFNRIDV